MKIKVLKQDELVLPKKANDRDGGYDVVATTDPKIVGSKTEDANKEYYHEIDYIEYGTGLFIAPEDLVGIVDLKTSEVVLAEYVHTLAFPRSSVSKKHLQLCNCVALIDNPYRGEIKIRFNYNWQPNDMRVVGTRSEKYIVGEINKNKIYKKGDKFVQLMFLREFGPVEFEVVDELPESERGENGFGSSDKDKKPVD